MKLILWIWCIVFSCYSSSWGQDSIPKKHALLLLPGFGSRINGTGALKRYFKKAEMPVYVASYISRKSIKKSTENLEHYYQTHELSQYDELHVMAYIVGAWTLNPWIIQHGKRNIKTIIYDRSPLQERAPTILIEDLKLVNALLFGEITKDFIKTPYSNLRDTSIHMGIFIETYATNVVRRHQKTALRLGPIRWDVESLQQRYDDFTYIPLNHDQMYTKPQEFGQEVFYFIKHGHFSEGFKRNVPVQNPFIKLKKR
ncbi:MAG: hypothetical protein K9I97_02880 [Cryomorphaceae bacterium]|jgi:hypothetical protein|nr:hypothetical protein [Cryomorphaceae bacterium]